MSRQRPIGINHVALQVDSVEHALRFYGEMFEFELRGREPGAAFIGLGDQFIALFEPGAGETEPHFGLVVADKQETRRALERAGAEVLPGGRLDFRDPWGNRVQVVQYDQIQFTKADRILEGMGVALAKSQRALDELRDAGLA